MQIKRVAKGDKFEYIGPQGPITNADTLEWITKLRIPPAWTDVRIWTTGKQTCCGYDDKGRLQCLYSQGHVEKARRQKFCDLIEFGIQLPAIERDIKNALGNQRLNKAKLIALVLKIIQDCSFRLGNVCYEINNDSYGITTITWDHVSFTKDGVDISFIGKKGVLNECHLDDIQLVAIFRELYKERPSNDKHVMLYQEGGTRQHIKHTDVNKWLQSYHSNITSKDFRVFKANLKMIELLEDPVPLAPNKRKKNVIEALREASSTIHNTPAICRKDYVLGSILEAYLEHPVKYRAAFITPTTSSRIKFINWLKKICD